MTPKPISKDDVNAVFQRNDGTLWRLIGFAEQPTATWESVEGKVDGRDIVLAVGSPLAREFTRLVAES